MKYNARQNVKISQSSQIPNHSNFGRFTNQECSMPDYDVPRKNFYRQNIENNANGLNAKDEILINFFFHITLVKFNLNVC